ncbi:MAG: hypothetical protein LBC53_08850, partial [Spirochaetaceae bacterium]|nr:hypothetical protein [Spirochaetaceae bacterium]
MISDGKNTFAARNVFLQELIRKTLSPLIDADYCFLELPYYSNVGDVLIWHGTECFLKTLKFKCGYKASSVTFNPKRVNSGAVILLQGGGNFGDLWGG